MTRVWRGGVRCDMRVGVPAVLEARRTVRGGLVSIDGHGPRFMHCATRRRWSGPRVR